MTVDRATTVIRPRQDTAAGIPSETGAPHCPNGRTTPGWPSRQVISSPLEATLGQYDDDDDDFKQEKVPQGSDLPPLLNGIAR